MNLDEILQSAGRHKRRRRIGRGNGSGYGKTAGRGMRGFHQRAGSNKMFGFEGGQNPMLARIPQRGFNNANFRKEYQIVNLDTLEERFEPGTRVDAQALAAQRLIDADGGPVKVLGRGELTKKLTVAVEKVSKSAAEKIARAGGTVEQV
ncbi:MAG TPA: 50S ribosomal protein L15 [Phycisphaerae bacterium]|nr:50S ribosomal protein L15 [Phycisphaerae bacterium]